MKNTEGKVVNDIDENEKLLEKKNSVKNIKKLMIIILIFSLVLIILLIILIFTIFKKDKDSSNESNNEDDQHNDDKTQLDTIPAEEFEKARKSFKQRKFTVTDELLSNLTLNYNLFIPENYNINEKYPLIMFITDKSLIGKEITAPITETVGGPIWATDTVQKKHKCFVLCPQYNEGVVDGTWHKSEYLYATLKLISELEEEFNIDKNRIYGTGQSMGAMATLYLLSNHQDLFAAGLIADGHWSIEELHGLENATFTFFAAEGDPNPFKCQNEVKEYFDSQNIPYGNLTELNAQEKVEILDDYAKKMYELGYKQNFITYAKGTVLPPGSEGKNEHMASFKYDYRIEAVRDWIFEQIKG